MDFQRIAAILLIAGFIVFWAANIYSPPGVYQESDLDKRLAIVNSHQLRWVISQAGGVVGIVIISMGLILLSISLRTERPWWITDLPAILSLLAVVLLSIYIYIYISDPSTIWSRSGEHALMLVATLLLLGSGLLFGILFLQAGFPAWLGYISIGYALIGAVVFLGFRSPAFYVMAPYYFLPLAVGIVMLRAG